MFSINQTEYNMLGHLPLRKQSDHKLFNEIGWKEEIVNFSCDEIFICDLCEADWKYLFANFEAYWSWAIWKSGIYEK